MLQHYLLQKLSSVVLITAWIVSGLYKAVYLASFFHASAVQTREATAAERKNTVQRPLRVQQREGSPALESGPQHQQRSRGRRVLWTRTIEYLTVHLQPQSTLRHLYTLLFIIIELNQAPGRLTPNITTVWSLYFFVLFFRICNLYMSPASSGTLLSSGTSLGAADSPSYYRPSNVHHSAQSDLLLEPGLYCI